MKSSSDLLKELDELMETYFKKATKELANFKNGQD